MSQQERIDAINGKIVENNSKIQNMLATDESSATANDIKAHKTAWVGGRRIYGTLSEQAKTVTLGADAPQNVLPDSGKVLAGVAFNYDTNVIKAENIKKDVRILGITGTHEGGGVTPTGKINITGTSEVDVTNYASAQVVDADLVASNIKKNVNILGITGTYEGSGGGGGEQVVEIGRVSTDASGTPTIIVHFAETLSAAPTTLKKLFFVNDGGLEGQEYIVLLLFNGFMWHVKQYGENVVVDRTENFVDATITFSEEDIRISSSNPAFMNLMGGVEGESLLYNSIAIVE